MSAEQMVDVFRALSPPDFRVLLATELGMSSREYVPISRIVHYANLLEEEVSKRLPDLVDRHLLVSGSARALGYAGFHLTFLGYDCLALNALVRRETISALGQPIGLGKESDVYLARGKRGPVALKFHRLGRISFRQTRRARGYVADRFHTSWVYQARMAATREYEAMKIAYSAGVPVPRPIGQNRHLVAMGEFDGSELSKSRIARDPAKALKQILLKMRRLFCNAHLIHGDLSEYNILIADSGRFVFIDWPQSVDRSDPRADGLLTRDVSNIVRFFANRYRVTVPVQMGLDFVRGKRRSVVMTSGGSTLV